MTDPTPERRSTLPDLTAKYQRAVACCRGGAADRVTARTLLLECVQRDPGNLIFVETFLQIVQRTQPQSGRWPRRLRGFWDRVAFERGYRTENWSEVVQRGVQLLVVRPSDGAVLCGLGEAMSQLGHPDIALRFWSAADSAHPDDQVVQRCCAAAYTRIGLFEQARRCWQTVVDRAPNDQQAAEMLQRLRVPLPTSEESADDACPVPPPEDGATLRHHDALLRCEQLCQQGDIAAAVKSLENASKASPGDLQIAEKLEDLELDRARKRVHLARQQTEFAPDEKLMAGLQSDLVRREISVFGGRAARYPQQHQWKLKLAQSLKQAGNFVEACRILSEIPPGSVSQTLVHLQWGECLQHQRQFDQALKHYAAAADAGHPELDADEQLACYRTGVLALQLGDLPKAKTYLQQLADSSPTYKDVRQHLDKIDSIRDKDGFSLD